MSAYSLLVSLAGWTLFLAAVWLNNRLTRERDALRRRVAEAARASFIDGYGEGQAHHGWWCREAGNRDGAEELAWSESWCRDEFGGES